MAPFDGPPVLVIDAASPVVSVAVGTVADSSARLLAERSLELRRSSERLLPLLHEALEEAGLAIADLAGMVALRGPGSFTGLRVGLATVLGFHQATGVPATTLDTPDVLAWSHLRQDGGPGTVAGAVDSLRGEWFVAGFRADGDNLAPTAPGNLLAADALAASGFAAIVGFGVSRLAVDGPELVEPGPLASAGLDLAARALGMPDTWDPSALTRPLYARPPAVSLPGTPKRVGGSAPA
jgi:tRNA threonylcarbamoyl adenosine modification protein YeaZ